MVMPPDGSPRRRNQYDSMTWSATLLVTSLPHTALISPHSWISPASVSRAKPWKRMVRREGLEGCAPETLGAVLPELVFPVLAEDQKKEPKVLDTGEADGI